MARTRQNRMVELKSDLAAERALNRAMRERLSNMRHELRSVKARANDYAHLWAVYRGGSVSSGDSGDVSSGPDVHG